VADRVVVMYAGKVMERGGVFDVFERPSHPYTRALLDCLPGRGEGTGSIGGRLPSPTDPPPGCRFAPRCPHAVDACEEGDQPPATPVDGDDDHVVSCVHYEPGGDPSVVRGEDAGAVDDHAADGGRPRDGGSDR
jgi:peptide/nickel transport system ATP-binding protein